MGLPVEHIWLLSRVRLKIIHWRLSPEPPELAGSTSTAFAKLKRSADRAAARGQPLSDPHRSRAAAMGDSSMSASELRNRYHQGGSAGDADLSASQLRARYGIASNRAGM